MTLIWTLNLLSISVLVYLIYLSRRKVRTLKRMEEFRFRVASDLHDDIGATLSSISFYSEAAKKKLLADKPEESLGILNRIGISSRETMENMNDIVWMVNPRYDGSDSLFERLEDYGRGLFAPRGIAFMFYADPVLKGMHFTIRNDFYLICKEALNNASKYAECTVVELLIKNEGSGIVTFIKDNGKGFDENTVKKGNGLLNMKVRADSIASTLSVLSETGKGTTVRLHIASPPN